MNFVKRVLPNGKVEFTRTFYVVFWLIAVGLTVSCAGLVVAALRTIR